MIHELADVQSKSIGEDTLIWQFVIVLPEARIGSHCNINCHVFIENDVEIGDYVTIKPGVQIWDGLRIGNHVFIGPNVTFVNDRIPRSKQYPEKFQSTIIEDGASIGANATILGGLTIGKNALIGAGAVLTKNAPACSVWVGNPARQVGYIADDGNRLDMQLIRKETGKKYQFINEALVPES
jgi:UDP-2-acetamido-3-amino-2,3-dideoxy-glucuronate N-acetyltransferase